MSDEEPRGAVTMAPWVGRVAEDVPPGWMDNMIRRLLIQANVELLRLENAKHDTRNDDEKKREADSRTLARLENSIVRLIRFEAERASLRSMKVVGSNAGALEKLIARIDREAEALGTDETAAEAE
jgi:hypothetical protein